MNKLITWNELLKFNYKIVIIKLNRNNDIEEKYNIHKKNLLKNNILLKDYLINKLFNNDPKIKFKLSINQFPYNTDKNIKHLLLWINPLYLYNKNNENNTEISFKNITEEFNYMKNIFLSLIKDNKEIYLDRSIKDLIIFKNSQKTKSIKDIEHYHIFLLL